MGTASPTTKHNTVGVENMFAIKKNRNWTTMTLFTTKSISTECLPCSRHRGLVGLPPVAPEPWVFIQMTCSTFPSTHPTPFPRPRRKSTLPKTSAGLELTFVWFFGTEINANLDFHGCRQIRSHETAQNCFDSQIRVSSDPWPHKSRLHCDCSGI